MKQKLYKSAIILGLSLIATQSALANATNASGSCLHDLKEMRAEITKWHGPVHACNAMIDTINKGPVSIHYGTVSLCNPPSAQEIKAMQAKGLICSHLCDTYTYPGGICTWQRGNWTKSLWYSHP